MPRKKHPGANDGDDSQSRIVAGFDDLFEKARVEFENGFHLEARSSLELLLAAYPTHRDARGAYAWVLLELGESWERVANQYELVVTQNPTHSRFWTLYGIAAYEYGKMDDALRCADKAIELDPLNYDAFEIRARCLLRCGRNEEAEDDLFHLLFVAPGWRDNISPDMQDVMNALWGEEKAKENIEDSRLAPKPQAIVGKGSNFPQPLLDEILKRLCRDALALNRSLRRHQNPARAYLVVGEQYGGEGLAGSSVDEFLPNQWVVSIPLPLIYWFHLLMLLIDRPLPAEEHPDDGDATNFWRLRGIDANLRVQRHEEAFDVDGEAWSDEFRGFLKQSGRELFKIVVDPESSGEERRAALDKVAERLPGYSSKSERDFTAWADRLATATTHATQFVLLHELSHVFSKHRNIEKGYNSLLDGPRVWRWLSEIMADRHAAVSLLRMTYDAEDPINNTFVGLCYALAMVMTTVALHEKMDPDSAVLLKYPPPVLRLLGIWLTVNEEEDYRPGVSVMMYHFMGSAIAVGRACDWPEFVESVRELFLTAPSPEDRTFVGLHQPDFIRKTLAAGGSPIIMGPEPDEAYNS